MKTAKVINVSGPWGAEKSDWDHFTFILGLTEDLLPVVSNPDAPISPTSKLASKGKVPSVYNGQAQMVGMKGWTTKQSTDAEIRKWQPISDYGICVQTRRVRALDVDVSDASMAKRIKDRVSDLLGITLPCRTRGNASKFLLTFDMPGEFPKRIIKTDKGNVEFLGTGQQFIAIGTHPSGARYVWENGLPFEIPSVDPHDFESVWSMIAEEFGNGTTTTMSVGRKGQGGGVVPTEDLIGDYLDENGWTMAEGRQGERHIRCPFEEGHSMGQAGDGSTTYFPPDAEYAQGHFKCLHGSCADRSDGDFMYAIGFIGASLSSYVIPQDETSALAPPLPSFVRANNGEILPTVENVAKAIAHGGMLGMDVAFDEFKDEIVWSEPGKKQWRPFTDSDYVQLRIRMEQRDFKPVSRELVRDVVHFVAKQHSFDTAIEWINRLKWDGVHRVERFLVDYFGVEDTPYHRAVSKYLWTALAGRTVEPGVKADMVPILVGDQGLLKSTAVSKLAPSPDFFCEIAFSEKEQDLSRKMRGRLVAEIPELKGLNSRDLESIKAFITRTQEDWTPKFKEYNTKYYRRLVFVGTTNDHEFLADPTGNRRWLPVSVSRADAKGIEAVRDQLWAEAAALYTVEGVAFEDAEKLGREKHEDHIIAEPWTLAIHHWLHTEDVISGDFPRDRECLRTMDVLRGALGLEAKSITRGSEMRAATALRHLGYRRVRRNAQGARFWVFVKVPHNALH